MTKIVRSITNRLQDRTSRIRNRPSERMERSLPDFPERNLGGGVAIGAVNAGVATALEDVIGVPFGGSTDIIEVEAMQGGVKYVMNVNAPTENMAEARAFIDSSTGFTSYLTDLYDVESVDVVKTRTLRDTYQIELVIRD